MNTVTLYKEKNNFCIFFWRVGLFFCIFGHKLIKQDIMMTLQDKELLAKKGISEQQIAAQLACFKKGFPYLKLFAAASVENGILAPDTDEQKKYLDAWEA